MRLLQTHDWVLPWRDEEVRQVEDAVLFESPKRDRAKSVPTFDEFWNPILGHPLSRNLYLMNRFFEFWFRYF